MNWSDESSYEAIFVAFFLVRFTRNLLETPTRLPIWDMYFKYAWAFGFIFMAIGEIMPDPWLTWYWVVVYGAIGYTIYQLNDYRPARTWLLAIAPYALIVVLDDVLDRLAPDLSKASKNYLESARAFGFIWTIAFGFVARNQKKTLFRQQQEHQQELEQRRVIEAKKNELEYLVAERTAEITRQKETLEQTVEELKATQSQLVQSEKMASLGELTAGIAHEIQNPLNFVNNFSEVSIELLNELAEERARPDRDVDLEGEILSDLKQNLQKINHHGGRASSIVKGMLQHSRAGSGQREPTDINALADEYLRLAYHGFRAKDKTFNALLNTDFDVSLKPISVVPQDIGRVLLNLFTNAFYAVHQRKQVQEGDESGYQPAVTVRSQSVDDEVVITVIDNGTGIPESAKQKIFQPFFTTKPTGEGTGLGLSLAYDIVKGHGGTFTVDSVEGEGTTFTVSLPA